MVDRTGKERTVRVGFAYVAQSKTAINLLFAL